MGNGVTRPQLPVRQIMGAFFHMEQTGHPGADNPPLMVHQIGADLEFHFSGFTNVNHPSPVSGGLQCQQATCGITGTIERNIRATVGEFGDNLRQTFGGC